MGQSKSIVRFDDVKKEIVFHLSSEMWNAFTRYFTKGELYLPFSEVWKNRLMPNGRKMSSDIKYNYVVVAWNPTKTEGWLCGISGMDVRKVPVRKCERAGKHIVLFTTYKTKLS